MAEHFHHHHLLRRSISSSDRRLVFVLADCRSLILRFNSPSLSPGPFFFSLEFDFVLVPFSFSLTSGRGGRTAAPSAWCSAPQGCVAYSIFAASTADGGGGLALSRPPTRALSLSPYKPPLATPFPFPILPSVLSVRFYVSLPPSASGIGASASASFLLSSHSLGFAVVDIFPRLELLVDRHTYIHTYIHTTP